MKSFDKQLIMHLLELNLTEFYNRIDQPYTEKELKLLHFGKWAKENNIPLSRANNKRFFYKSYFYVSPFVLDPRPETERLVEYVVKQKPKSVLDLGTGSGCIIISIASELSESKCIGVDISRYALENAKYNAGLCSSSRLEENGTFINNSKDTTCTKKQPPLIQDDLVYSSRNQGKIEAIQHSEIQTKIDFDLSDSNGSKNSIFNAAYFSETQAESEFTTSSEMQDELSLVRNSAMNQSRMQFEPSLLDCGKTKQDQANQSGEIQRENVPISSIKSKLGITLSDCDCYKNPVLNSAYPTFATIQDKVDFMSPSKIQGKLHLTTPFTTNLDFVLSDYYFNITQTFDVIVSNPAYVKTNVAYEAAFDPPIALFSSTSYEKIIQPEHLNPGGKLVLEVPEYSLEEVIQLGRQKNLELILHEEIGSELYMVVFVKA